MTIPNYRFPKDRRLLKAEEFDRVFKLGRRKRLGCLTFFYGENTLPHARLGFAVSKRSVRLAVKRNGVKRVVREQIRLRLGQIRCVDIVVTANDKTARCGKEGLREAVQEFIKMMGK